MKNWCCLAGMVMVATIAFSTTASAQSPQVVVMDVTKVFEKLESFKAEIEQIAAEAEQYEAGLKVEQEKLQKMVEAREEMAVGSAAYKTAEENIAKTNAELQTKLMLKRKDFLEREAKIYYRYYAQIKEQTSLFCQKHKVSLVLNYDSTPIDGTNRQSVQMGIRNPIVYQTNLDVTSLLIDQINAAGPAKEIAISAKPAGMTR